MKPDSDLPNISNQIDQRPSRLNNANRSTTNTRRKPLANSVLPKALSEQLDVISKHQWISSAAYYKAQARGFVPGYEIRDWLDAEQDYTRMLITAFLSATQEDGGMTITSVQELAKAFGVQDPEKSFSEAELIRLIQSACHEDPCFRTRFGQPCEDQESCQWQTECQKLIAEWRR